MINTNSSFCRNEKKYLISKAAIPSFIAGLRGHIDFDPNSHGGSYNVNTLYFDTEDYAMIARSVSHPTYKEKIRLRSYGGDKPCFFLEFKNKIGSDVYKNRIRLSESEAKAFVEHGVIPSPTGDYKHDRFLSLLTLEEKRRGPIVPKCLIQYQRMAFCSRPDEPYTRITIDTHLRSRGQDFAINKPGGTELVAPDMAILEIKVGQALPLYLVKLLNETGAKRTAFSKYGTAFLFSQNVSKAGLEPGRECWEAKDISQPLSTQLKLA